MEAVPYSLRSSFREENMRILSSALRYATFTLIAFVLQVSAQTITGSIAGRVVDQQGATIANASVTVTEPAKNVIIAGKTGAGGDFSVAGLLPGTYSVSVEASGFKKLSRGGIVLDANDK